jgi:hypothetical protein
MRHGAPHFVAAAEPTRWLPLRPAGVSEQKSEEARIGSARWLTFVKREVSFLADPTLVSRTWRKSARDCTVADPTKDGQ